MLPRAFQLPKAHLRLKAPWTCCRGAGTTVTARRDAAGMRADRFLAAAFDLPKHSVQKALRLKRVKHACAPGDGLPPALRPADRIHAGARFRVPASWAPRSRFGHELASLSEVAPGAGPGPGGRGQCAPNAEEALRAVLPPRWRLVASNHALAVLDKPPGASVQPVGGCVAVALSRAAAASFRCAAAREPGGPAGAGEAEWAVRKEYVAEVILRDPRRFWAALGAAGGEDEGTWTADSGRGVPTPLRAQGRGRGEVTLVRLLAPPLPADRPCCRGAPRARGRCLCLGRKAFLALQAVTGRRHQLRRHCADLLGAPVVGDGAYDRGSGNGGRARPVIHLHAARLCVQSASGGWALDATSMPRWMPRAVFPFPEPGGQSNNNDSGSGGGSSGDARAHKGAAVGAGGVPQRQAVVGAPYEEAPHLSPPSPAGR